MNEGRQWPTVRRVLGVVGFVYLLVIEATTKVELPLPLYGLIGGLLGLDWILDLRREGASDERE